MIFHKHAIRRLCPALLALGLGLSLLSGCDSLLKRDDPAESSSSPAPTATSSEADALAKFRRDHDLRGKVVFLQFGQLGCDRSHAGLVDMIDMYELEAFPDLALARVEVSEPSEAMTAYFEEVSPPFVVYRDSGRELARQLGVTGFPQYVLLDKWGNVRYRGPMPDQLGAWADVLAAETLDPGPDVERFALPREVDITALLRRTSLPNLDGQTRLLQDYMGPEGLMLMFVDLTCPYCMETLGDFEKVSTGMDRLRVTPLIVNLENPASAVKAHYEKAELGAAVVYDTGQDVRLSWAIDSVPKVILLDPDGEVHYNGNAVWDDVADATERMQGLAPGSVEFKAEGTGFG
jgi:thioredoxin-related protein